MSKLPLRAAAFAALAFLAACATPGPRGTEVTRFHLGQPIPVQGIVVEPAEPMGGSSLEFRTYAAIVAAELARIGFAEAGSGEAEMVAVIDVARGVEYQPAQRSPVSIGIGGGSFGRNVGVGVGTSVGLGGSRGGEVTVTQLEVKLQRRSEGTVVWEGRAIRASEPGAEDPAEMVRRLAAALFQDFPGESGRTITVE